MIDQSGVAPPRDEPRVRAARAERLSRLDPLLAARWPSMTGTVTLRDTDVGEPQALATVALRTYPADSLDAFWGPLTRCVLTALIAGPDVDGASRRLLGALHDWLAAQRGPFGVDSAVVVDLPSRDVAVNRAFYDHGFAPRTILAVRVVAKARPHGGDQPATDPPGVTVRRAGIADRDVLADFWRRLNAYDALAGACFDRPALDYAFTDETERILRRPDPWAWLAEREGRPIGMAVAEHPDATGWVAKPLAVGPVAYFGQLWVRPDQRHGGVGTALARRVHAAIDASGTVATLLHHGAANPLSAPFWARMGYRPLLAEWRAQPITALR